MLSFFLSAIYFQVFYNLVDLPLNLRFVFSVNVSFEYFQKLYILGNARTFLKQPTTEWSHLKSMTTASVSVTASVTKRRKRIPFYSCQKMSKAYVESQLLSLCPSLGSPWCPEMKSPQHPTSKRRERLTLAFLWKRVLFSFLLLQWKLGGQNGWKREKWLIGGNRRSQDHLLR